MDLSWRRHLEGMGEAGAAAMGTHIWLNTSRSVSDRVEALLKAMTTRQKVLNLGSDATMGGIPELGLPPFVWQVRPGQVGVHCTAGATAAVTGGWARNTPSCYSSALVQQGALCE